MRKAARDLGVGGKTELLQLPLVQPQHTTVLDQWGWLEWQMVQCLGEKIVRESQSTQVGKGWHLHKILHWLNVNYKDNG